MFIILQKRSYKWSKHGPKLQEETELRRRSRLQFGHPGGVEAHGHAGRAGSVPHLPQHPAPLLLIVLVPDDSKGQGGSRTQKKKAMRNATWGALTARRRWPPWAPPPCSPPEPWRSRPWRTGSRRCSAGSRSSSPEETLWRAPTSGDNQIMLATSLREGARITWPLHLWSSQPQTSPTIAGLHWEKHPNH